jgi:H+-translocating NAD(P) transhydrogenase subunit alpha
VIKIAALKENQPNEKRVAISIDSVKEFVLMGFSVYIEAAAGELSGITDALYQEHGAIISSSKEEILRNATILLCVQAPQFSASELKIMPANIIIVGLLAPFENKKIISQFAENNFTSFTLELLPRITRAQSIDALSSQSNLTGYRAIIEAAYEIDRVFPMMTTSAGSIHPIKVLVLGIGVAGLQAIATAKRLEAIVFAFDNRADTKEQAESLGAKFLTPTEKESSQDLLIEYLPKVDVVICSALVMGKASPVLINKAMVESMKRGSIIVDLAISGGGNCQMSKADQVVEHQGVKIIAYSNMASRVANNASKLYAKNLLSFVKLIYNSITKELDLNLEDELIKQTLLTQNNAIVNHKIKEAYSG